MISGVRTIPFVKASACGNDFLLIDSSRTARRRISQPSPSGSAIGTTAWAPTAWNGCMPHFTADVEIRLINADGSDAEISGNGTRCVAAFVCAQQGKEKDFRFRPAPE